MKLSEMSKSNEKNTERQARRSYDELKDLSQEELLQKLAGEINKQKLNGSFDYESLKGSIEKISSYLPKETYENILRIIENFK